MKFSLLIAMVASLAAFEASATNYSGHESVKTSINLSSTSASGGGMSAPAKAGGYSFGGATKAGAAIKRQPHKTSVDTYSTDNYWANGSASGVQGGVDAASKASGRFKAKRFGGFGRR